MKLRIMSWVIRVIKMTGHKTQIQFVHKAAFSPLLSTLHTWSLLHGIRSWPLEIRFLPLSPTSHAPLSLPPALFHTLGLILYRPRSSLWPCPARAAPLQLSMGHAPFLFLCFRCDEWESHSGLSISTGILTSFFNRLSSHSSPPHGRTYTRALHPV
jgi:hypothetical protein